MKIETIHPCHRGVFVRFEHEGEQRTKEVQAWAQIVYGRAPEERTVIIPMIVTTATLVPILEVVAEYEIITERDMMEEIPSDDSPPKINTL